MVKIPPEKPFIFLRGAGKRKTVVVWDDHQSIEHATFSSLASNIFVKSMGFVVRNLLILESFMYTINIKLYFILFF